VGEGTAVNQILEGDCLEVMRGLADNSVDAIVTDPPYGFSQHDAPDIVDALKAWLAGEPYLRPGGGFMGKTWDSFVPGPEVWRECLRVLKPGGHALIFAAPRTQDLMGIALRLAGFEIRECLMWVFGSGFPKSHDVSKAIDREAGADRWSQPITAPATPAAKQWQGWGSALKPAYEPILLCRKPLEGTLAANVLEYGTGAINVDGCRVGTEESLRRPAGLTALGQNRGWNKHENKLMTTGGTTGRWPANLIHDGSEDVVGLFPLTGASKAGGKSGRDPGMWSGKKQTDRGGHNDNGGSAARFFYCAKSSKADRDEGLDAFAEKHAAAMQGNLVENQRLSGDGKPIATPLRRNHHPTVKPTDLMRYLCRLVTLPGGIVLDPFMGSGSTGKAAVLEGFQFIGIEREPEYIAIARARIADAVCRSKALTFDQQAAWLDGLPNQEHTPQKTIKRQLSIFDIGGHNAPPA
jgi:DNA modification methylase